MVIAADVGALTVSLPEPPKILTVVPPPNDAAYMPTVDINPAIISPIIRVLMVLPSVCFLLCDAAALALCHLAPVHHTDVTLSDLSGVEYKAIPQSRRGCPAIALGVCHPFFRGSFL